MIRVAVDNDVLLKLSVYGLHNKLSDEPAYDIQEMFYLGVAQFLLPKLVAKREASLSQKVVMQNIAELLGKMTVVEPTQKELELAAQIESIASERNLALDIGESQLCAIVTYRAINYMLTGDKRAIAAIGALYRSGELKAMSRKLVCFEQLILLWLNSDEAFKIIRGRVCADPTCDKALSLCFSCRAESIAPDNCVEGLKSYIGSLRQSAGDVLVND